MVYNYGDTIIIYEDHNKFYKFQFFGSTQERNLLWFLIKIFLYNLLILNGKIKPSSKIFGYDFGRNGQS